jgi:photosystem II stability/assembly factor-like uncharacterized protein
MNGPQWKFVVIVLMTLLTTTNTAAQWQKIINRVPSLSFVIERPGRILLGAKNGMFVSEDEWRTYRDTLPGLDAFNIQTVLELGQRILIGTHKGVYQSMDEGRSWEKTGAALSGKMVWALVSYDEMILASTNYGSPDSARSWKERQTSGLGQMKLWWMQRAQSCLFGGSGGAFRSLDTGRTWSQTGSFADPNGLLAVGGTLLIGDGYGIYRSTDTGNTWTRCVEGLPERIAPDSSTCFCVKNLECVRGVVFAAVKSWLFYSIDTGAHWIDAMHDFPRTGVYTVRTTPDYIYVESGHLGVYRRRIDEILATPREELPLPRDAHFVSISPNPAQGRVRIDYVAGASAPVQLALYSMLGVRECSYLLTGAGPGVQSMAIETASVRPGCYVCVLKSARTSDARLLVVY